MNIRRQLPRVGNSKLYFMLEKPLLDNNLKIGCDKLFSILKEEYLLVRKRRKYTKSINSRQWLRKYPNITKDIILNQPEQLWVADITYLPDKKGHEYPHLIADAYFKWIMGYEVSDTLCMSAALTALRLRW